jgi:hypothetical protein
MAVPAPPQLAVDRAEMEKRINELHARQSIPMAVIGGLLAAVVGALIWAVITVVTSYQIGWMAVGIGFAVGGAIRMLGHGLDKSFGYLGAILSLFGCLLGNFLSICMVIATQEGLSPLMVVTHIDPAVIPSLLIATFHPLDPLFYGIAMYEGYRFSYRRVTEAEVNRGIQQD